MDAESGPVTGGAADAGDVPATSASEAGRRLRSTVVARRRVRVMSASLDPHYWAGETLDMLKSGTRIAGVAVREK